MLRRSILISLSLVSLSVIVYSGLGSHFIPETSAQTIFNNSNLTAEDQFCKSKLFNSVSKETCAAACPGGAGDCVQVQSYKKEFNSALEEDLDCYACSSSVSCYDMGFIYNPWDCWGCEIDPDKMCVSAVGGGLPGIPSISLPKDSDGVQCWDCVNRPDTCWKHFPGSTVKSACDRVCAGKPDHKCVNVGVNPDDGRGCFVCQKNPPLPETCHDWGFLYQNECNQCPPARPKCEPAVGAGFFFPAGQPIKDDKGKACYECNPKPKTCEEQGLPSKCAADEICDPVAAPNGASCCSCRKKPRTCQDFHYKTPPCQCKPDEIPISASFDDGTGTGNKIECCDCAKDKCYPDLNPQRCLEECQNKGGKCQDITRERGAPPCYRCVWPKEEEQEPKTCQDIYLHDKCRPNPCSEDETCEMVEVNLDGKKTKCAECVPKEVDPSACENHTNAAYPSHRLPNCAPCFQANMACDEKQVSTNPPLTCAKCLDPVDMRCEPPTLPGQCIGSQCSDGSVCENVGNLCHICRPKKSCTDLDLPQSCPSDQKCTPVLAENGDECCQCTPKSCRDIDKQSANVCNNCGSDSECKKDGTAPDGEQCWTCIKKETPPPPPPEEPPDNCAALPGSTEDPNCEGKCPKAQCKCQKVFAPQTTTTPGGTQYDYKFNCCRCEEPPALPCPQGAQHGKCIPGTMDPCQPKGTCVDRSTEGADCYECRQRPVTGGEPQQQSFISLPTGSALDDAKDEFCDEEMGGYAYSDCLGDCPPHACVRGGTAMVFGLGSVTCYYCREPSADPRPLIYLPDGRIARVNSVEVTYLIVIIETPHGRVILGKDKNAGPLADFEPASIMALAKYDPSMGSLESLGAASNAGGTILKIASKLTDVLEHQKVLDRFFEAFSIAKFPVSLPGGNAFGALAQNLSVSGPVVVSGKLKNQPALAVFDSGGALAGVIAKKDLKKNPNMILETLAAAGHSSQRYAETPIATQVEAMDTTSIARPYKAKKKKKKKNEEEIVPNDPLYSQSGRKRRSTPKINLGSALKMGGVSLGGGSRGDGPQVNDQWGLQEIGFTPKSDPDSAWNVIDGSQRNVLVAVIDSGMDMTHPDGPQYIWENPGEIPDNGIDDDGNGFVDDVHGWNFVENNSDLTDLKGHGTFVAGIIAARTNNGIGIAGINPGAVIMPLRVADKYGQTDSLRIFRAIQYAVAKGAKVMNISLGGRGISKLEESAIANARDKGVFITISSGNSGENISGHGPASAPGAFAVGAIDYEGGRSAISNWGPNNALLAPGEKIYSIHSKDAPWEGGSADRERLYYTQSGTSFSSPMAAATASLLLAKDPQLTPQQIEDILSATASDMEDVGWDEETGAGLLDASAALRTGPQQLVHAKITGFKVNYDETSRRKNDVASLDIFGTVRGEFDSFTVEVGRGKKASRFEKVAGPFKSQADNDWITRIDKSQLKGGDDWVIKINVTDKKGKTRAAQLPVNLQE